MNAWEPVGRTLIRMEEDGRPRRGAARSRVITSTSHESPINHEGITTSEMNSLTFAGSWTFMSLTPRHIHTSLIPNELRHTPPPTCKNNGSAIQAIIILFNGQSLHIDLSHLQRTPSSNHASYRILRNIFFLHILRATSRSPFSGSSTLLFVLHS